MRVLMLGWEYPPHISGGLGTACEGITRGLARQQLEILFVVPHLYGDEEATHMRLLNSRGENTREAFEDRDRSSENLPCKIRSNIQKRRIASHLLPYQSTQSFRKYTEKLSSLIKGESSAFLNSDDAWLELLFEDLGRAKSFVSYGGDIFAEVARFAAQVSSLFLHEYFDVIHAHDWMTYPAGVHLSRITGKPLVVHVHSLEQDRSGMNVNHDIQQIERVGMDAAQAVIAVSYFTRNLIHQHHGVPLEKISVVHNGVYPGEALQTYRGQKRWPAKLVLFLGRITFQKGPEYFVEAAAKVLPHVPDVMFVMAGAGDMLPRMVERVKELGIENHFLFPGFLKGQEVEEMFSLADLYVMPSVSEPFGISALEAIKFETPVIISRQSGVSEVLSHALKADFWDIDRMADLIINALLHPELREDMVSMAREEVTRLHWDAAALKTTEVYRSLR